MNLNSFCKAALILLFFSMSAQTVHGLDGGAVLNVEMSGFRNNTGKARVCLFNRKEGFPLRPEEAFQVVLSNISEGRARAEFSKVPPGNYAVGVLHDENSNGRMDTNTLGMPKEGVGASNNQKSLFGPPGFEDASFNLTETKKTISVIIRYP